MEGVKFVPGGTEGELIMNGALTIENAAGIRNAVGEALAATDSLVLTIGENADVDVTFLQILCSAHRTSVKAKKRLDVNTSRGSIFFRVLSESGLDSRNGCSHNRDGGCLWKRGGGDE